MAKGDEEIRLISVNDLSLRDQRSVVFQLSYALDAAQYTVSLDAIRDNFRRGFLLEIPSDSAVFKETEAVISSRESLDTIINPLLKNWRFERLSTITRIILRIGIWELQYADVDAAVIINETVELAKCFAEKDAYKFVNGLLDFYAKSQGGLIVD